MRKLLANTPVGLRLVVAGLVPVLAFLFLSLSNMLDVLEQRRKAIQVRTVGEATPFISKLIDEMQRGRGLAVLAISANTDAARQATEEISQQVTGIQTSTKSAVDGHHETLGSRNSGPGGRRRADRRCRQADRGDRGADQSSGAQCHHAVNEISAAMRSIDEVTTAIASAVEEQGAATREISSNVQMAARGTQTLASNISNVNDAIGETNLSAESVVGASGNVTDAAEQLADEVKNFFVALRTGPLDRRKAVDPGYTGPERRKEPCGSRAA